MTDSILTVEGLQVNYGHVDAVRDISIDVPAGALVTLVGANGAGKTSILNAVSGLLRPRRGTIRFKGRDVTRWPAHKMVKAGLVQVPEGREILGTLTVAGNLMLGGWHRGSTVQAGVTRMYERFPVLADRRKLMAGSLSGGEQQMLAIARALIAEPECAAGRAFDGPGDKDCRRGLRRHREMILQTGTTVVLVEQNARRALAAADFGHVLETGEITHSGAAADLLADERVVEAYLGLE